MNVLSAWAQVGEFVAGNGAAGGAGTFRIVPGPLGPAGHRGMPAGTYVEYGIDHQDSRVSQDAGQPTYTAFGEIMSGTLDSPMGFQGQEWRSEAGLYYMRHRWYDAEVGRWMSRDPVVQGTVSSYGFAHASPVHLWDPDGLDAIVINYRFYQVNTGLGFRLPLGHSGVVAIDPTSGRTRYYEFGRYDGLKCGKVRRKLVPDVKIGTDGLPTADSLQNLYSFLTDKIGHGAAAVPTYYPDADFAGTVAFAESVMNDPNRACYSLLTNNCKTFAHDAATACREGEECAP